MPQDLAQLYDAHAPALYAFLLNLTRHEADTRDLLQEIFLKVARRPETLDAARDPRAFLLGTAHHLVIDAARRRASYQAAVERAGFESPELFAPGVAAADDDFRAAVASALGDLPPEQRAVVHLKLWEDMTFARIAETLGISLNTAASRYRYALDKLRAQLRPLCEP